MLHGINNCKFSDVTIWGARDGFIPLRNKLIMKWKYRDLRRERVEEHIEGRKTWEKVTLAKGNLFNLI